MFNVVKIVAAADSSSTDNGWGGVSELVPADGFPVEGFPTLEALAEFVADLAGPDTVVGPLREGYRGGRSVLFADYVYTDQDIEERGQVVADLF